MDPSARQSAASNSACTCTLLTDSTTLLLQQQKHTTITKHIFKKTAGDSGSKRSAQNKIKHELLPDHSVRRRASRHVKVSSVENVQLLTPGPWWKILVHMSFIWGWGVTEWQRSGSFETGSTSPFIPVRAGVKWRVNSPELSKRKDFKTAAAPIFTKTRRFDYITQIFPPVAPRPWWIRFKDASDDLHNGPSYLSDLLLPVLCFLLSVLSELKEVSRLQGLYIRHYDSVGAFKSKL